MSVTVFPTLLSCRKGTGRFVRTKVYLSPLVFTDVCPLLVVDGSSALLASYPHVFGQEFELQTTTYKQGTRAFYTTVGNLTTAYLYYDGDHWAAGQLFADTTEVLFSAPTNQTSPDKVTEGWNAAGGGVNITVTCKSESHAEQIQLRQTKLHAADTRYRKRCCKRLSRFQVQSLCGTSPRRNQERFFSFFIKYEPFKMQDPFPT